MYPVEMYANVRRACLAEGMSARETSQVFGLHRDTVRKMLTYSVPPGYRCPKLEPYTGVIHAIPGSRCRLRLPRQSARQLGVSSGSLYVSVSTDTSLSKTRFPAGFLGD